MQNRENRRVFLEKRGDPLIEWEERGPKSKRDRSSPSSRCGTGEAAGAVGGGQSGRSRSLGRSGPKGKGEGGCGRSTPCLTSSCGGVQRRLGGSGRRWDEVVRGGGAAAAREEAAVAGLAREVEE